MEHKQQEEEEDSFYSPMEESIINGSDDEEKIKLRLMRASLLNKDPSCKVTNPSHSPSLLL